MGTPRHSCGHARYSRGRPEAFLWHPKAFFPQGNLMGTTRHPCGHARLSYGHPEAFLWHPKAFL
eukprot:1063033-Pelagomonas_calceolata.AAC.1